MIEIRKFTEEDFNNVFNLIQNTIDTSYNGVYPKEAIDFFKNHHSKDNILKDAAAGYTIVAETRGKIFGTGTILDTNIRRIFVSPTHQHKGIGKLLMQELLNKAQSQNISIVDLDASLSSLRFWESLGFMIQREEFIPVANNQRLGYYKMVRTIRKEDSHPSDR
jgi:ribosomal protein S18 acetylase RimI-like enzyme